MLYKDKEKYLKYKIYFVNAMKTGMNVDIDYINVSGTFLEYTKKRKASP